MFRIQFTLSTLLLFVFAIALIMFLNFKPTTLSFAEGGQYGYPVPFYRTFRVKEKIPLNKLSQEQLDELSEVLGSDYDMTLRVASQVGLSTEDLTLAMDRDRFLTLRFIADLVAWVFLLFLLLLIHSFVVFHFSPIPQRPESAQEQRENEPIYKKSEG